MACGSIATNPAHSWIDQGRLRDILGRLDFLVVQDMYHSTETAQLADLVLPAAAWGEKEGTFINSERRIGLIKKVRACSGPGPCPISTSSSWLPSTTGAAQLFDRWESPEAVFQILKKLSAGMPCDFSGIADYRMLDEARGIQWPLPGPRGRRGPGAPALRRRAVLSSRRSRPVSLRGAAGTPEPPR